MNKNILAIFDFCETLVDFQSIPPYLEIASLHNPHMAKQNKTKKPRGLKKMCHRFARSIYKRTRWESLQKYMPSTTKPVYFEALKGLEVEVAENLAKDYVKNELLKRANQKIINKLEWHKAQGHTIAIVSGGLEIYIKYFADYFGIPRENIIAIELESSGGILTGNMNGIHTMEHRKLYKLVERINLSEFDLQKSYFYSDCPSDIPLLSFVGNPVVAECGKDILWAKILGYKIM